MGKDKVGTNEELRGAGQVPDSEQAQKGELEGTSYSFGDFIESLANDIKAIHYTAVNVILGMFSTGIKESSGKELEKIRAKDVAFQAKILHGKNLVSPFQAAQGQSANATKNLGDYLVINFNERKLEKILPEALASQAVRSSNIFATTPLSGQFEPQPTTETIERTAINKIEGDGVYEIQTSNRQPLLYIQQGESKFIFNPAVGLIRTENPTVDIGKMLKRSGQTTAQFSQLRHVDNTSPDSSNWSSLDL